ncbi:hypothetical protein NQ315_013104 [Exocentrus adspersus]|uniref:Protein artemis n=1 Tax=Exocentrus adspersus TaxID=1586481 RepID=A0AAV8VX40_9CUCU|nr:hypothetical protein NQ315_013104 [Exocentrus adspersus]
MSTFGGKIEEIPHISVDRFDGRNFESEAYFLSHCHTDHMVGLDNWNFQDNLVKNNKYLYASDVSRAILKNQFPYLENNIKVLDMYTPTIVVLKNGNISVLPIPAGHCPGSVMFLFETNTRVLYTGDYRINKNDIRKLKAFYDSFKQVKAIEKIYLDTTFFLRSYLKFPKREESLEELCKIINEWISKGKNYTIKLSTSARYGYEYMFNEIYKKTGMPVHVNQAAFELYSIIPEMDNSITVDGCTTQIHCSCGSSYQYVCNDASTGEMRTIKVSAFRWTQDNLEDGFSSASSNIYYVCYSTHASYEEGLELIRFLKPKSVEMCVQHEDPYTNMEIAKLIDEVLQECTPKKETDEVGYKLFGFEETKLEAKEEIGFQSDDLGILDSPPRDTGCSRKRYQKVKSVALVSCNVEKQLNCDENNAFGFCSLQVKTDEVCDAPVKDLAVPGVGTLANIGEPPIKRLK